MPSWSSSSSSTLESYTVNKYQCRPSRGQRVIISKRQGLRRINLCGLQDLRPAISQRLL